MVKNEDIVAVFPYCVAQGMSRVAEVYSFIVNFADMDVRWTVKVSLLYYGAVCFHFALLRCLG